MTTKTRTTARRNDARARAARGEIQYQGSKWCRPEFRLAVYARDGFACCYCGAGEEAGLSLDHIKAHAAGGDNASTNLLTCCRLCNSKRQDGAFTTFARNAGKDPAALRVLARRPIDRELGKSLLAARKATRAA